MSSFKFDCEVICKNTFEHPTTNPSVPSSEMSIETLKKTFLPACVKSVGRKQNIMFLKYSETYLLNSLGLCIPFHVRTYVLIIVRTHQFLFSVIILHFFPSSYSGFPLSTLFCVSCWQLHWNIHHRPNPLILKYCLSPSLKLQASWKQMLCFIYLSLSSVPRTVPGTH